MRLPVAACAFSLLAGCATPTVVEIVQGDDPELSCPQLQSEYAQAPKLKKAAQSEKGLTGANLARLIIWPTLVGTYMNSNEAIAAADARRVHLADLMSQKNCAIPPGKSTRKLIAPAALPTRSDANAISAQCSDKAGNSRSWQLPETPRQ